MNKKFNIGIIGAGSISDLHCSAIKETRKGELYDVFDINGVASKKLKDQFPELRIYNSLEGIVNDKNIDTFAILAPPKNHYRIIEKIVRDTDKPIFCEKPLVIDKEEYSNILDIPNGDNRIFVGQSYRYFPQIIEAKKYFEETRDTLKYFEIKFRKHIHKIRPLGGWRSEYEDYVIADNGMHIFDLLTYLTGQKIVKSYCQAENNSGVINGFDTAFVNVELEGGAKGTIALEHDNMISNTPYMGDHYYRFDKRTLSLDKGKLVEYIDNQKEVIKENLLINPSIVEDWQGSFTKMWGSFFDNIKNSDKMEICPGNLKNSLYGVLMTIESAKNKKIVMEHEYGKKE
ncbi:MAG: Gfo/Idh/MocA family oxidoreductase [Nanoarchaeota archaeon]